MSAKIMFSMPGNAPWTW